MEYAFLFGATLLAYIAKGVSGFGNTLVMGSLFSLVVPNKQTTPADLLMSIPANAYIALSGRKSISLKVVVPLSCLVIAGTIPGALLLNVGSDWGLRAALGILTILIAADIWLGKSAISNKGNKIFLICAGVLSGLLTGMYGISALLVLYVRKTSENMNRFRADICSVFLVENIFRLALYLAMGIITRETVIFTLSLSPAIAIGLFAGVKISKRIDEETAVKIIAALLAVSGTILFIRSVAFH